MLNKELFFAVGAPTIEGHTKLTVGENSQAITKEYGWFPTSAMTKVPQWYNINKTTLVPLYALSSSIDATGTPTTHLIFPDFNRCFYDTIKIKNLETGATVTLQVQQVLSAGSWWYIANMLFFTATDVGKTFNLEFDPPPDGYL